MTEFPHDHETTGLNVDRLVCTEIRVRSNLPYGEINDLRRAAQEEAGGSLTHRAASALRDAIDPGDVVLVVTGAGGNAWLPHGETDGPPGAVGLARTLALACGARPVVAAEDHATDSIRAVAHAAGLNVLPEDRLRERHEAMSVVPYPKSREAGAETAERLLADHDPAAVVAVEKGSPNAEGVYHSATGSSMDDVRAKVAPLFERAAEEGILTVGIGDNGNEVGFGRIEAEAREILPHGETCECPCGGGVVGHVATDHLVVANTSNWGAYGVAAMVALLDANRDAFHDPDVESRMLAAANREGSSDGVYSRPVPRVDGTSEATQRGVVAMLADVVDCRLDELRRAY